MAPALRVAVSLGIGLAIITSSGCHQQAAVSDIPKAALAPPVQTPDALARAAAGEAQQRQLQQQFFEMNSPRPNGAPVKKTQAASVNPSQ
jgi:hypothetical protein